MGDKESEGQVTKKKAIEAATLFEVACWLCAIEDARALANPKKPKKARGK